MPRFTSRDISAFSAALLLALTIVLPAAVLYSRNTAEFTFRASVLLGWLSLLALALALAAYAGQRLFRDRPGFVPINALLIGGSFSLWLEILFHAFNLGRHEAMISSFDPSLGLLMIIEALVLLAPLLLAWRFRHWVSRNAWRLAGIAICTQLVPLVTPVLSRPQSESQHFEYTVGEGGKFAFGSQANVIVVVIDCLGEQLFKQTMAQYEELPELFKDFTCFDRMVSPIPTTQFAVPAILTSVEYPEKTAPSLDDAHSRYLQRAFASETSLFVALKKAGFRCEGYPYVLQTISYDPALLDNAVPLSSHHQSWYTLLDVWAADVTPYFLQPLLGNAYYSVTDRFVTPGEYTMGRVFDSHDSIIYRRIQAEARLGEDPKVFKYIHLQGPHVPVATDEHLELNLETSRVRQLRGTMLILEDLFEKLQEFGLYDQSLLVITGDHSERYTPEVVTLIKRPGAKGETLSYNAVPCRLSDIAHTVRAELALAPSELSLFSREPVASTGTRELPPPVIWPVEQWEHQREPAARKPFISMQNNFVIRDGRLLIAKKEHMAYNRAIVHFIFQRFDDPQTRWSSPDIEVDPSARSEFYRVVFPDVPDGVYLLFLREQPPPDLLMTPPEEGGVIVPPEPGAGISTNCFPRYIWIKDGDFSLHRRHPLLGRNPLPVGTTAEFALMQPVPYVDYSNDCRLDGKGLRLFRDSWLGLYLPEDAAGKTLRLGINVIANSQMIVTVKHDNDVIHQQRISNKNGNHHELAFAIPALAPDQDLLKLTFSVKPRFKNRAERREVPVQLKTIAIEIPTP